MIKTLYSALFLEGHPFDSLTKEIEVVNVPSDLKEQDSILVVWGGADISPTLYGHEQSVTTHPGERRDVAEWALMQEAKRKGIPIIGVCRGAQMLCALAGGYLIQDVKGHFGRHTINTINGDVLQVNSIHHQMMAGFEEVGHKLLAWATTNQSSRYIYKDDQVWTPPENWKEPEFIYFTDIKGFAIQWHPEMMSSNEPATKFVLETIKEELCLNTMNA